MVEFTYTEIGFRRIAAQEVIIVTLSPLVVSSSQAEEKDLCLSSSEIILLISRWVLWF